MDKIYDFYKNGVSASGKSRLITEQENCLKDIKKGQVYMVKVGDECRPCIIISNKTSLGRFQVCPLTTKHRTHSFCVLQGEYNNTIDGREVFPPLDNEVSCEQILCYITTLTNTDMKNLDKAISKFLGLTPENLE